MKFFIQLFLPRLILWRRCPSKELVGVKMRMAGVPEKVKDMHKCAFTHLSYDALRSRNINTHVPARLTTEGEMREWLFQHGKLLCRWVYVVELHPTSQSCGGEARRMYKREVSAFTDNLPLRTLGTLPTSAKCDSPGYSR